MSQIVVLVNPNAGGGRAIAIWERLRDSFAGTAVDVIREGDRATAVIADAPQGAAGAPS